MKRKERVPLADGVEYDAFTDWRHLFSWKLGRGWVKKKYNKRLRKKLKEETRNERVDRDAE
jgi:hypothetical protein